MMFFRNVSFTQKSTTHLGSLTVFRGKVTISTTTTTNNNSLDASVVVILGPSLVVSFLMMVLEVTGLLGLAVVFFLFLVLHRLQRVVILALQAADGFASWC